MECERQLHVNQLFSMLEFQQVRVSLAEPQHPPPNLLLPARVSGTLSTADKNLDHHTISCIGTVQQTGRSAT
ncbi:hypothetical protein DAEQUDRAFT_721735 [Daedalea quercina L-15889]|uniref:Uncharacterized protein n=1 Tax=Daedalea quercina L-15889 TaxID=1314783 RepID=A0A165TME5_9APHY|nr:hypothetical protein DAEQUDRAFT_721735 [Daedalea quercina L-15889]